MNCDEVCDELRAKLAEKEAELAAAREELEECIDMLKYINEYNTEVGRVLPINIQDRVEIACKALKEAT